MRVREAASGQTLTVALPGMLCSILRGISASPDEILLTMGAQNALWLVTQVLLGPGTACATP